MHARWTISLAAAFVAGVVALSAALSVNAVQAATTTPGGATAGAALVGVLESEGAGNHANEGSHEGEAPSLNPLESWKPDLAIWTAVVFVLLLLVLGKFAWKPLLEGLAKREQGIADQIDQAQAANRQAKDLLVQYEQKLESAQEEVRGMLDKARRDADAAGHAIVEKARQEASSEHERALRQIDAATASAVKELADKAADLAVDLAGKIVGAKLQPKDHTALIEKAVSDFAARGPSRN